MVNTLLVDDREPAGLEFLIQANGVPAERRRLECGDMQFIDRDSDLIIVTRKGSDLLTSLFDGHFSDEVSRCMTTINALGGGRLYFLMEGVWRSVGPDNVGQFKCGDAFQEGHYQGVHRQWGFHSTSGAMHNSRFAVVAGLMSALQSAGVYFVQTATVEDTATLLSVLYKQGQDGWPSGLALSLNRKVAKWQRDDASQRVARLMSIWPKLSENKARDLLTAHGDIGPIVALAKDNPPALHIRGIGDGMVKNFQEIVWSKGV